MLNGLQLLRCMGCLFVVQAHINRDHMLGFFSLDIFFLISGFVMALLVSKPGLSQDRFLKDRLTRVLALSWPLTLAVFGLALVAPSLMNSTTADPVNLLKSLFFIPYYKENGVITPILAVAWTLNYEILFYAFCTLSFLFKVAYRIPLVSLAMLSVYGLAHLFPGTGAASEFYAGYYMLEFPAGMLLWVLYQRHGQQQISKQGGLFAMLGLIVLLTLVDIRWNGVIDRLWLFALPSMLLVWLALIYEPHVGKGPLVRLGVLIGDASYSIYMTHIFVIEFLHKLVPRVIPGFSLDNVPGILFGLTLSLVVGILIDLYFYKPAVRIIGDWLRARRPLAMTVAKA